MCYHEMPNTKTEMKSSDMSREFAVIIDRKAIDANRYVGSGDHKEVYLVAHRSDLSRWERFEGLRFVAGTESIYRPEKPIRNPNGGHSVAWLEADKVEVTLDGKNWGELKSDLSGAPVVGAPAPDTGLYIRVLKNGAEAAEVKKGQVMKISRLTVTASYDVPAKDAVTTFYVSVADRGMESYWGFQHEGESFKAANAETQALFDKLKIGLSSLDLSSLE